MPQQPDPQTSAPTSEPEAVQSAEVSALARHGDPSMPNPKDDGALANPSADRISGLQWVRASDLFTRGAVRVADRSVNHQQVVVRRVRTGIGRLNPVSRRGIARRSARGTVLAPVSDFGQQPPTPLTIPAIRIAQ